MYVLKWIEKSLDEEYYVPSSVYGINEGELDHRCEQKYRAAQKPNLTCLYVRDLRQRIFHFRRERHKCQDSVCSWKNLSFVRISKILFVQCIIYILIVREYVDILPRTIRGALASWCNQKDTQEITTINIDGT